MRGKHCLVWGWSYDGELVQGCPHCGYKANIWTSISDTDDERVKESQKSHREHCPGSPLCMFKKRRYEDE